LYNSFFSHIVGEDFYILINCLLPVKYKINFIHHKIYICGYINQKKIIIKFEDMN